MDDPTRLSYDVVASDYAAAVGNELAGKPLDRALLRAFAELTGGGVVADLGCGPGHVTSALDGLGVRPFGMDLSPGMCAYAARTTSLRFCAADMCALPIRSAGVAGIVCLYAVIHLDEPARHGAYREFARVLRPGGTALIAFHTSSAETPTGESMSVTSWWGHDVDLTFRYLNPDYEAQALHDAGLTLVARLDRAPHPGVEHESRRTYLLVRSPA
jgi:SAM-dependent methyltransferase